MRSPTKPWRYYMTVDARLRISVTTGEFEIQGSEAFVAQYDSLIQDLLSRVLDSAATIPTALSPRTEPTGHGQATKETVDLMPSLPEFGEALHRMPKGT